LHNSSSVFIDRQNFVGGFVGGFLNNVGGLKSELFIDLK